MDATEKRPEVLLIGMGGVGVLYAFILQNGGANVTAVCRSNYEAVRDRGIDVISDKFGEHTRWRPTRVARSPEDVRDIQFDFVVCTFKNVPDVVSDADVVRPYLERSAAHRPARLPYVVLLQNGIDFEQETHEALCTGPSPLAGGIISGVNWVGVTLVGQGSRIEHGLLEAMTVGAYPCPIEQPVAPEHVAAVQRFVDIARAGGSQTTLSDDMIATRWRKITWNISWGGLTTLARRPVMELLQPETLPYSLGVVRGIMLEMMAIVRASGIGEDRVPAQIVDDNTFLTLKSTPAKLRISRSPDAFLESKADTLRADFKPSILVDLERSRPMELEVIFTNMLRRARQYNVETPRLDMIVAALKPSQLEFVRSARGMSADPSAECDLHPRGHITAGAPVL